MLPFQGQVEPPSQSTLSWVLDKKAQKVLKNYFFPMQFPPHFPSQVRLLASKSAFRENQQAGVG